MGVGGFTDFGFRVEGRGRGKGERRAESGERRAESGERERGGEGEGEGEEASNRIEGTMFAREVCDAGRQAGLLEVWGYGIALG